MERLPTPSLRAVETTSSWNALRPAAMACGSFHSALFLHTSAAFSCKSENFRSKPDGNNLVAIAKCLPVFANYAQETVSSRVPGTLLPAVGPAAWFGNAMALQDTWKHQLSPTHLRELDAAISLAEQQGHAIEEITADSFPLPSLRFELQKLQEEVLCGCGFLLLRGLPVHRYSRWQAIAAFWGIGTCFGWAVPQNRQGHLVGHVRDLGNDPSIPTVRIYSTNAAQPFHTDSCDVVGLLCLHPAREGGLSSVSSSVTIYNEMLQERPDLVQILHEPFYYDRKGEIPAGKLPYYKMPVMHTYGGNLSVIYARGFIQAAQRFPEVPRLTPLQIEALDMMDALAARPDIRLDMNLEPGDMQFLHNHQTVHARTAFSDFEEEDRKRHLLRLWLSPPNGRPLPPIFAERYGSVKVGKDRGGIKCPGVTPFVPLDPS